MEVRPPQRTRISLLAVRDTYMSSLSGFYDTFSIASELSRGRIGFALEIVAASEELEIHTSGMRIRPDRLLDEVRDTDLVIVPTTVANGANWVAGTYPSETRWLRRMYEQGSTLCSACSGALLLAEAGLLDGKEITTHWQLTSTFRDNFPSVRLGLEKELIENSGGRIITSGASAAWHDLALYLIARFGDAELAYESARFFMFQWHAEGQALYLGFEEKLDHGDGAILKAQSWITQNFDASSPVEAMTEHSGLSERSFKRRFREATGHSPISYVQQLRIKEAKRLLIGSPESIEGIAWRVGYDDPSAFRRLFKRITRVTPGVYRRKMEIRQPYRSS